MSKSLNKKQINTLDHVITRTISHEILSRALFEKNENLKKFKLILQEDFTNIPKTFYHQIYTPDIIFFHLIGRTKQFFKRLKFLYFEPLLRNCCEIASDLKK